MNHENREMVLAILDGEIHRFSELVHRFDTRVRQVIGGSVSEPATRDDLVQDTFYRDFKNLEQLRDPDQLEAWLAAIARRCVTDHWRKTKRTPRATRSTAMVDWDQIAEADKQNRIWEEVAALPVHMAEVLRLRYLSSFKYEEIAQRLQVPVSTVRGRIYEARKALRNRLRDHGYFS